MAQPTGAGQHFDRRQTTTAFTRRVYRPMPNRWPASFRRQPLRQNVRLSLNSRANAAVGHIQGFGLLADGRISQNQCGNQYASQSERRLIVAEASTLGDAYFFQELRSREWVQASAQTTLHDAAHKGHGRAVKDRNFGSVDFNQRVVHTTSRQVRP